MGIPDLDFETMIYDSNVRKYAFVWEKELRNGNFEPGSHVLASAYNSDCHRLFHCLLSTICILFPWRGFLAHWIWFCTLHQNLKLVQLVFQSNVLRSTLHSLFLQLIIWYFIYSKRILFEKLFGSRYPLSNFKPWPTPWSRPFRNLAMWSWCFFLVMFYINDITTVSWL